MDEKLYFGAELGDSQQLTVGAASTSVTLKQGRYLIYPVDLTGGTSRCWVRQGAEGVTATAGEPCTLMGTGALGGIELTARPGPINSGQRADATLAVIGDAGVTGTLHIVKISRRRL